MPIPSNITRANFDEAYYFGLYPDVKRAYDIGHVPSAYDHFVQGGYNEGRLYRLITPATTPPATIPAPLPPVTGLYPAPGILDGEIFGIDKKLVLIGAVAAYFFMSGK